jgi:hypothetical protein
MVDGSLVIDGKRGSSLAPVGVVVGSGGAVNERGGRVGEAAGAKERETGALVASTTLGGGFLLIDGAIVSGGDKVGSVFGAKLSASSVANLSQKPSSSAFVSS